MCWCDPSCRTPNCGKPGCHPPGEPAADSGLKLLTFPAQPRTANPRPVPGVIEMLEGLLARAKSGELRSLAVAGELVDDVVTGCSSPESVAKLTGAIGLLNWRSHSTLWDHKGSERK